jgi:hypothetical protein
MKLFSVKISLTLLKDNIMAGQFTVVANSQNLVSPEIYDQYGNYIGIDQSINRNSIVTKGLEIRLLSNPTDLEHTITVGDIITIIN